MTPTDDSNVIQLSEYYRPIYCGECGSYEKRLLQYLDGTLKLVCAECDSVFRLHIELMGEDDDN